MYHSLISMMQGLYHGWQAGGRGGVAESAADGSGRAEAAVER